MFKEFSNNKDDDYLNEFRQKIASERQAQLQARKLDLQRSRNGFIGTIAGILLAGAVSWFLLVPKFNENQNQEIPIIRKPITPVKIRPDNPGGMEIQNQNMPVYALVEKHKTDVVKIESILPKPETPKLPEIVPEPEVQKNDTTDNQEIDNNVENKITLPVNNLDELIEKVETTSDKKIEIPQKPANIDIDVKTVEKNVDVKQVMSESKENNSTVSAQVWQLQLMASSNLDSVKKGFIDLKSKYSVLDSLPHEIQEVKTDSKNTLYRLKVGSFNTRDNADKLCAELKQKGLNCIVKQR